MTDERQESIDRFWENIDPSIDGYSRMIANLLTYLTDEELENLTEVMDPSES